MPRTQIDGELIEDKTIENVDIGATGDAYDSTNYVLISIGGGYVDWIYIGDLIDQTKSFASDPHDLNGTAHTGIPGTENNFMSIDSNGLPQDSGYNASDFEGGGDDIIELIDVYDNAGGQTTTGTPITLNLDTERQNIGNVFSLSGDVVTADTTGYFVFTVRVSTELNTGADRSGSVAWLEENTGTGFVEVDGFRGWMYNRTNNEAQNTCTMIGVLEIQPGYQYRVRVNRSYGSSTIETIADGSGLLIHPAKGAKGIAGPQGPQGPPGQNGATAPHNLDGTSHIGIVGTVGNFMAINEDGLPVDSGYDATSIGASITLPDNVAYIDSNQTITGGWTFSTISPEFTISPVFGNNVIWLARNTSNVAENCFWARAGDNNTYLNYGSGGNFFIRNNSAEIQYRFTDDSLYCYGSDVYNVNRVRFDLRPDEPQWFDDGDMWVMESPDSTSEHNLHVMVSNEPHPVILNKHIQAYNTTLVDINSAAGNYINWNGVDFISSDYLKLIVLIILLFEF